MLSIFLISFRQPLSLSFLQSIAMSVSSSTVGGGRTKYKIIFLGDQSVGKSSIIEKYIKDKFQEGLNPTVGIDFHIKNVTRNGRQYRIQLWDTAGQERFRSLIPNYMKDANCAVMVYDVSKKTSLDNLKIWNEMFEEHQTPDAVKVFVGNKIDLTDRQVSKKEGEAQASKYQSKHFEVSAKLGKKLDELFNSIIDLIIDHLENRGNLPAIEEKEDRKEVKEGKDTKGKSPEEQQQATSFALKRQNPVGENMQPRKGCC